MWLDGCLALQTGGCAAEDSLLQWLADLTQVCVRELNHVTSILQLSTKVLKPKLVH